MHGFSILYLLILRLGWVISSLSFILLQVSGSTTVTYRADQLRTLAGVYQLRVLALAAAGGGAAAISGIIASIN